MLSVSVKSILARIGISHRQPADLYGNRNCRIGLGRALRDLQPIALAGLITVAVAAKNSGESAYSG